MTIGNINFFSLLYQNELIPIKQKKPRRNSSLNPIYFCNIKLNLFSCLVRINNVSNSHCKAAVESGAPQRLTFDVAHWTQTELTSKMPLGLTWQGNSTPTTTPNTRARFVRHQALEISVCERQFRAEFSTANTCS